MRLIHKFLLSSYTTHTINAGRDDKPLVQNKLNASPRIYMFVQCTLSFTFVRVYRQIQKVEYHSCSSSSSSSSSIPNHTSKTTSSAIQSSVAATAPRRRTSQNPMLTNFSTCVRQRRITHIYPSG